MPDSPDPVEIAMDLERGDRSADSPARRLLVDQGRLVRSQIVNERMGAVLKLLTGLAGLIAVAVLGIMAWRASDTEQLVLQPFSVPPELEGRGLTGQVVATKLRDALAAMQANRISTRAPSSYADDWTATPEIEIPQTGVSLNEIQQALSDWLGKEVRISGEVVRTPAGYQVTARAAGEPGQSFIGTEAELDKTIQQAAEAVYRMTQPDRYAGWLAEEGKRQEAAKLYQELSIRGSRAERAWVFAEWAGLEREPAKRLERARAAQALDPDHPVAAVQVAHNLRELGRWGEALPAYGRSARLLSGTRADELAPWWARLYAMEHRAEAAALLGDYGTAARINEAASEPAPDQPPLACSNCSSYASLMSGRDLARNHDGVGARAAAARAANIFPDFAPVFRAYPELLIARAVEDWPVLAVLAGRVRGDRYLNAITKQSLGEPVILAWQAEALARTGRTADARATLAGTGDDCLPCLNARGMVDAIVGDRRSAERWFARAARVAPDLPQPPAELGRARLGWGDKAGALAAFRQARRLGPRWADPAKGEGDALFALGRFREAARAYAEAAARAPRWGALRLAWARALHATGDRAGTLARLREAGPLTLSAADRATWRQAVARLRGA